MHTLVKGKTDLVSSFLKNKANIDQRDSRGDTALMKTIIRGRENIENVLSLLLEQNANIYIKNRRGESALSLIING